MYITIIIIKLITIVLWLKTKSLLYPGNNLPEYNNDINNHNNIAIYIYINYMYLIASSSAGVSLSSAKY